MHLTAQQYVYKHLERGAFIIPIFKKGRYFMADEKKKPEEETPQDEKKSETPAEEKLIYAK